MQRLEVTGAVRPLEWSLGVKGLILLIIKLGRIFTILYLNKTMFINHIVSQVFYSYHLCYM